MPEKGKMTAEPNPAPGFISHPDHTVSLRAEKQSVVVYFAGEKIAESKNALVVIEGGYQPRYYIPKTDVRMDLLEPTNHETYCPFKGNARYWTVRAGGEMLENGAWAYDYPFDETADLAGHISFYTEHMTLKVSG